MGQRGTISRTVEFGFRVLGFWPGLSYAAINSSLCMLILLINQYFLYSYAVLHFDVNYISELIDCLGVAFAVTLLTLKLVNLTLKRRAICEIIDAIAEDWNEASISSSSMTVMLRNAELSRTYSNILISFNSLGVFVYVIGGYVIDSIQSNNDTREIPVRMLLPFDYSTSPIFELTVLAQFLYQLFLSILLGVLEGFLLTLILHISGQIDIVCENVRQVPLKPFEFMSTMRKLIYRHEKIIDFINNINNLFSFIALLEFVWNTIVICCIGFAIMASIGTEDAPTMITKSLIFYIAVALEAFIFCYSGEYLSAKLSNRKLTGAVNYSFPEALCFAWLDSVDPLSDFRDTILIFTFLMEIYESKSIGDAVYESLWYNLKPRECRVLLVIIMRSQQHLTITAGGLMDLSLDVFTNIMKTSVSYISVLHALY